MSFKTKISPKSVSLVFGILVGCFLVGFYILAVWQDPLVAPPGGNVAIPLNTGSDSQEKEGPLVINRGGAAIGFIVEKGNVGIGATSNLRKLTIESTAPDAVWLRGNRGGSSSAIAAEFIAEANVDYRGRGLFMPHSDTGDQTAPNAWFVGVPYTGGGFQIGNSNVHAYNSPNGPYYKDNAKLFIKENGNVGIGTTNPSSRLDLGDGDIRAESIYSNYLFANKMMVDTLYTVGDYIYFDSDVSVPLNTIYANRLQATTDLTANSVYALRIYADLSLDAQAITANTVTANYYELGDGDFGKDRTVTVKGSDGNNCNLVFNGGLLVDETCPE